MKSYEQEIQDKINLREELPAKLEISILKYLWQTSPFCSNKLDAIPYFLRNVESLRNFSENELRILSKYLHWRSFNPKEVIFKQSDVGVGFYFIFSGQVQILAMDQELINEIELKSDKNQNYVNQETKRNNFQVIATLQRYEHFGELALLQENSLRTATAIANSECSLLGIFKPDMENIIYYDPIVAGKLLQSISVILANRLTAITNELRTLKQKYSDERGK